MPRRPRVAATGRDRQAIRPQGVPVQSEDPRPSPFPQVSGYRIERLLGAGGMAEVYLATQISLDRQVALKVLSANSGAASEAISRFEQEAQLIARLSHPHIVGIHDIGRTAAGALYYAMPYLPQGDLERRAGPLPEAEVIGILEALLSALEHAHAMGVIHRDLKPANILFDQHRRPLLADFGVALNVVSLTRVTGADHTVGSAGYMSPEQARAWPVDGRSDLYCLGAVAFELLTGQRPYPGEDAVAVAIAQWEQPLPRLPAPLQRWQPWLVRALARRPEDRYQTASAMRAALPTVKPGREGPRPHGWWARREATAPLTPATRRQLRLPGDTSVPGLPFGRWGRVLAALVLLVPALLWLLWYSDWNPPTAADADSEDAVALIRAGRLWPPARPNALEVLARVPANADEAQTVARLRLQLIDAMQARLAAAVTARDWVVAEDAMAGLADASRLFEVPLQGIRNESYRRIASHVQTEFEQAISLGERLSADPALRISAQLPLTPALAKLRRRVVALSLPGQDFSDPGAPTMQVLRPARASQPGLAITAQPITPAQWSLFARPEDATAGSCSSAVAAQSCLGLAAAQDYADWLSRNSGAQYRLPSRSEWAAAAASVGGAKGLWLWTRDCHLQTRVVDRPNAIERGIGSVRSVFGGRKARPETETRCQGQFVSSLSDPKQIRIVSDGKGAANIVLVLVRTL
ncbi:MAG: protein kinase [Lysobacterales bacterium]